MANNYVSGINEPQVLAVINKITSNIEKLESRFIEIDNIISNSLVKYTIDRLSYVDRAIIRLATYEMKFLNLAKEVAIDEALLITREYSSLENDAQVKFNNKLLDNISKVIYE